jgi:purine-binding chemotaxis protein CheW
VTSESSAFLLCLVGPTLWALPIEHVIETMRPLTTVELAGTPPFVSGVAVVRGQPIPVLDVSRLLAPVPTPSQRVTARFVTVRIGARRAALAVDAVVGIRALEEGSGMPPLLGKVGAGAVSAIRALDAELLLVLESARMVPDVVWTAIDAGLGRS